MNGIVSGRPARRRSAARAALGVAVAVACGFGCLQQAVAQTEPDELARHHFESGAAYFEEAEYAEALKAFEKAYELSKRPGILLNISVVQERLNNLPAAIAALNDYLERTPDDTDVDTLRRRRDNLQRRLEDQQGGTPKAQGTGTNGTTVTLGDPLKPAEPEPIRPPESSSSTFDIPLSYVFLGAGAATTVGALATGLVAQLEYGDLKRSCAPHCAAAETRTGQALATTSTVLTGVAVVTLGVGAWLWFHPSEKPAVPSVSLAGTPELAFAQARWVF